MMGMVAVGEEVKVRGRVATIGGQLSLIPSVPDGVEGRTDCAVMMSGSGLPVADARVTVSGVLNGREIVVTGWEPENSDLFSWEERSQAPGVDEETLQEIRRSRPKEWEIVGSGAAKT